MKKINLIFAIIIAMMYSCQQEDLNIKEMDARQDSQLRSLHPSGFENNWENQRNIKLTNGHNVELPWVSSAVSDVPFDIREDIKKINGWIFVSTSNMDAGSDYLIFYNRYTGILKVFYYNTSWTTNNNAIWTFYDINRIGLFNQGSYFTSPLNTVAETSVSVSPKSRSATLGIGNGWNCIQVPVVYTGKSGMIDISPMVMNISNFEFQGSYTEKTEGTILEKHSSNVVKDGLGSVVKASGGALDTWLKDKVKNESKSIFKNIGSTVIGNIANGGAVGLVDAGLNALFGSFLGKANKSEPKVYTVELTTTGELKGSGIIESPSTGIANMLNGIDASKFGAWNLTEAPKLTPSITEIILKDRSSNKKIITKYYLVDYYPSYKVRINPDIEKEVDVSISHKMVQFEGNRWESVFNDYYKYSQKSFVNGKIFTNKELKYDNFPTLYQDGENFDSSANRVKIAHAGVQVVLSSGYMLSPYQYYNFSDFENATYPLMGTREQRILNSFPDKSFTNGSINGKIGLYPGNFAVNITVTMTVKSSGEKIISSRTYIPEYIFSYD